jgi:hypothetical protein
MEYLEQLQEVDLNKLTVDGNIILSYYFNSYFMNLLNFNRYSKTYKLPIIYKLKINNTIINMDLNELEEYKNIDKTNHTDENILDMYNGFNIFRIDEITKAKVNNIRYLNFDNIIS